MINMDDIVCYECGAKEGYEELDGFYYCRVCSKQAEGIMDTEYELDQEQGNSNYHHRSIHRLKNPKTETVNLLSQSETQHSGVRRIEELRKPKEEYDEEEACILNDFGAGVDASQLSVEDISSELRIRYVMGVQLMIEFQCQVLVEKFGVSPLICGLAGVIWMRFVVASRVFDEQWAEQTFEDSEIQYQGFSEERTTLSQHTKGTVNMYGQSGVMIWFRSLRKRIPISSSLAVSFLACHIAREPILPTDIHTWALEGKLPYLTSFIDIEKRFGRPSNACPLSASIMFKPFKVIGSRELESQSGFIAQTIGLQVPPVNFFAIARRYLKKLSLPQDKILPHAARIYEWCMPPDLWLSANPKRLPSRVCVMSIIMLTVRLLYNINGFGMWEASLSRPSTPVKTKSRKRKSVSSDLKEQRGMFPTQSSDFNTTDLLCNLEATYEKIHDAHEYSKDLPTYLKYCKDVVFAGLKPVLEDTDEETVIEKLWNFYTRQEDMEDLFIDYKSTPRQQPRPTKPNDPSTSTHNAITISNHNEQDETPKETSIKRMKLNMEENGFCYIPPRVKMKRYDHLHYIRKNDNGSRTYVAHADYYILLRACAKVAQVSARYMHAGVLKLEKRLSWIENRIDQSLEFRSQTQEDISRVEESLQEIDVEQSQTCPDLVNFSHGEAV